MKTIIKTLISTILFLTMGLVALSQQLSGFVYETTPTVKKSPLTGVNVFWLGTTIGTVTDDKGKFQVSRKGISSNKLVVSLLGFRKDTIMIGSNNKIEIRMHSAEQVLAEVEITERRDDTFISKLNARQTQVINIGELQRAACCNLAESFETNASVDVSYSDAVTGAKQIQLLGLSGIYSQIMSENVPLIRGLASTYGLNYIPGPWMESIQVSKGTASVVNGYESTTGQINVEYKKPESIEKFYLNLYGNSDLRLEANMNGAVKINDRLSTALFFHVDDFRDKFDLNHDGFIDLPKMTTYNLFNRWYFAVPGHWESRFGIKYLDENRSGGQMEFNKNTLPEDGAMNYDTTGISNGTKTYGFGVKTKRLEAFWKNGFFIKDHPGSSFGLILSGVNHEQNSFYGINQYDAHERSLYVNLLFNTSIHNDVHKIAAGLSYLLDDFREDFNQTQLRYLYEVYPGTSEDTLFTLYDYKVVDFNMNRTEWVPGAFMEYTLHLKEKFTVIAGVRGDYDNLYGFFITPRLHLRYRFNETTTIRGSIGKGYRTANVLAENSSVFISQRKLVFGEKLNQENAWNFGINLSKEFKLFRNKATFDFDAYRTSFVNQVVVDQDSLPTSVFFYNLKGKSYANCIQAQFIFEPFKRFNVTLAFRYNDVKITENGILRPKAFVNQYKGLLTLSYATRAEKWKFDVTGQFNGSARLPDTWKMPEKLQQPSRSPEYFQLLAQITRKFKIIDIYLGGENLTNFVQENRIIEYWKPYHTHFDGSMVWGPVVGITVYAGLRLTIK